MPQDNTAAPTYMPVPLSCPEGWLPQMTCIFFCQQTLHSKRALTQETLSLANTIALGVDQLLKSAREASAQAFHIMVGINVLTYPFEPGTKLGHGLCPRLSGQSPLLTVADPRHTRLVQEHLLTAAWLKGAVLAAAALQVVLPQCSFILVRDPASVDVVKPLPTIDKDSV